MSGSSISFSIVIPTYNRFSLLRSTIESLFVQTHGGYEVIVVNDGGTDGTQGYLEKLQSEGRIRCFYQTNQGPARGRNLGIQHARGEYVAFIDDDCLAPPDWLEKYALRLSASKMDVLGGSCVTGNPENVFALTNDHIMNFFKRAVNREGGLLPFLTSNNTVYSIASLRGVGGFDPEFRLGAEERDLNLRLAEGGATLRYDPEIVIRHFNDENFSGFIRHQYLTGKGSFLLYRNAKRRAAKIAVRAPRSAYLRLILSPWTTYSIPRASVVFGLILIGQAAVTAGYVSAMMFGYRSE